MKRHESTDSMTDKLMHSPHRISRGTESKRSCMRSKPANVNLDLPVDSK